MDRPRHPSLYNLAAKARVNAYALALGPDTDAALLKQVFPNAAVVALPTEQLGPFLSRMPRRRSASTRLGRCSPPTSGGTIDVSWGPEGWATVTADEATLSVRAPDLPFDDGNRPAQAFRGLTLRSRGRPVRAVGLPERFELAAGQARVVTVHIDLPGEAGELPLGLEAELSTPVGRRPLRRPRPPPGTDAGGARPAQRSTSGRGRHDDGLGVVLIVLPALVLLLVGATVVARRRSRPPLTGSILVSGNDGTELDQALEGRSMRLPIPGETSGRHQEADHGTRRPASRSRRPLDRVRNHRRRPGGGRRSHRSPVAW